MESGDNKSGCQLVVMLCHVTTYKYGKAVVNCTFSGFHK